MTVKCYTRRQAAAVVLWAHRQARPLTWTFLPFGEVRGDTCWFCLFVSEYAAVIRAEAFHAGRCRTVSRFTSLSLIPSGWSQCILAPPRWLLLEKVTTGYSEKVNSSYWLLIHFDTFPKMGSFNIAFRGILMR